MKYLFISIFTCLWLSGIQGVNGQSPIVTHDDLVNPEGIKASHSGYTGSLPDLLNLALTRNHDILRARLQMSVSRAWSKQASLLPNPLLEWEHESQDDSQGVINTIQVRQGIYGWLSRKSSLKSAEYKVDRYQHEYEHQCNIVFAEIHRLFYALLYFKESLKVLDELILEASRTEEISRIRFESKASSELEYLRFRYVRHGLLKSKHVMAKQQHEALIRIQGLLGGYLINQSDLRGELRETFNFKPDVQFMENVMGRSHLIASLNLKIKESASHLESAKKKVWEGADVMLGISENDKTQSRSVWAGLSVPLPLFDRKQGLIEEKEKIAESDKLDLESSKNIIREATQRLQVELDFSQKQLELLSGMRPVMRRAFNLAKEGYQAGHSSPEELIETQQAFFQTEQDYLLSLHLLNQAMADWHGIYGRDCCAYFDQNTHISPKGIIPS